MLPILPSTGLEALTKLLAAANTEQGFPFRDWHSGYYNSASRFDWTCCPEFSVQRITASFLTLPAAAHVSTDFIVDTSKGSFDWHFQAIGTTQMCRFWGLDDPEPDSVLLFEPAGNTSCQATYRADKCTAFLDSWYETEVLKVLNTPAAAQLTPGELIQLLTSLVDGAPTTYSMIGPVHCIVSELGAALHVILLQHYGSWPALISPRVFVATSSAGKSCQAVLCPTSIELDRCCSRPCLGCLVNLKKSLALTTLSALPSCVSVLQD